jgi:hypothetical protein
MANMTSESLNGVKPLFNNDFFTTKAKNSSISDLVQAKYQADQESNLAKVNADDFFEGSPQGVQKAAYMQSFESAYQYSETMSLSLTTKEGDKVNVDFRQLYASYQSYKEFQAGEQGPDGVRYFESKEALEATAFEEHIGFSVEGDLNEEELQAIYDVFAKVDDLANSFFAGDIEQALQKAVDFDIDMSQIGSFSLNLTQTEMRVTQYKQAAMAEYQQAQRDATQEQALQEAQVQNQTDDEQSPADVANLPSYLEQWQSAIQSLEEHFVDAREKLDEWVAGLAAQRFPEQDSKSGWLERVREFHQRLAEAFDTRVTEPVDVAEEAEPAPAETAEKTVKDD